MSVGNRPKLIAIRAFSARFSKIFGFLGGRGKKVLAILAIDAIFGAASFG